MSSLFLKGLACIAAVFFIIFFITIDANAQWRRGRYALTGSLNWEYESYSFEDNRTRRERTRFLQVYNANLSGNIIDPRLIVFNAGLNYYLDTADTTDTGRTPQSSTDETSSLGYNVSFSFFPRSWHPFNLYASRVTQDSSTSYYPSTTTTTTSYGGDLTLGFIRLPRIYIYYNATDAETENPLYQFDVETQNYGATLTKRLDRWWDSSILAGYRGTAAEDKTANSETDTNVFYFSDHSAISKTTSLSINALKYDSSILEPLGRTESDYMSANIGLSMNPSRRFRHSYSYDYSNSESSSSISNTRGETTTNTLSGSAYYLIMRNWSVDGRLKYSMQDSEDSTASSATTRSTDIIDAGLNTGFTIKRDWTGSANLTYYTEETSGTTASSRDAAGVTVNSSWIINPNWSTTETVTYYTEDSYTGTQDISKESKGLIAHVRYTTPIRFLNFRSSYTFTYSSIEEPGNVQEYTAHAVDAGLGTSYKGRYLTASADYGFIFTTSSRGDRTNTHTLSLSATNTYFTRTTITAAAGVYFGDTTTLTSDDKGNSRSVSLGLSSTYFANTSISASAKYKESHVETGQISRESQTSLLEPLYLGGVARASKDTREWSAGASIGRFLGRFGSLSMSADYSLYEEVGALLGGLSKREIETTRLLAKHTMMITRRLRYEASVSNTETTDETDARTSQTDTTNANIAFNYSIGKWLLNASYKYTLLEETLDSSTYESTEKTLLFTIRRYFRLFM